MEFSDFKEEDFVADESFQNWVLEKDEASKIFWEEWIFDHSDKKDIIYRARDFLLNLNHEKEKVPHSVINSTWNKLDERIANSEGFDGSFTINILELLKGKGRLKVIIIIVLGLIIFAAYFNLALESKTVTVHSFFKEMRSTILPDGSKIILKDRSSLKYYKEWFGESERVIWLEGEALISISKNESNKKIFLINLSPSIKVETPNGSIKIWKKGSIIYIKPFAGPIKIIVNNSSTKRTIYLKPNQVVRIYNNKIIKVNNYN